MQTTNPLTEIGLLVLAALLVIGGVLLLYAGKIDTAFASSMFIIAAGLLGINGALKSPSPAQQAQLQSLTSQVLQTLPAVVSATQSQPTPQPAVQAATPHVADEFTAPLQAVPKP